MSIGSQGSLPFDFQDNQGQMPAGVNNPTAPPGSDYLGTQLNSLFNRLYHGIGSVPQMGSQMPAMSNFSGAQMPAQAQMPPVINTGIQQNANQQAGQQAAQSLGGLMSGTAAPGPNANALTFNVGAPPEPTPPPPIPLLGSGGYNAPLPAPIAQPQPTGNPLGATPGNPLGIGNDQMPTNFLTGHVYYPGEEDSTGLTSPVAPTSTT